MKIDKEHWLVQKAELVAMGVIASEDAEAIREFTEFLDSFAMRQRDKLLGLIKAQKN